MITEETAYQIAVLLSIVGFLAIRVYYRRKTRTLQLDVSASKDNTRLKIFIVILGVLALGLLIWVINPGWMSWSAAILPDWLRWSGIALVGAGLALLTWAHETLSASFSGNLEIRAEHKLVTTGPYRWIRHPIYSAIVLWTAGLALLSANWFIGLIPLAFAMFFMVRVRTEEQMMVEAFGKDYQEYIQRSGRFLPRVTG